jgi:hypothetical protein
MKNDDVDIFTTLTGIIAVFAIVLFFVAFALTLGYELAEFILRHA